MPKMDLSEITRLSVKDVWAHEAQDFTPWLAKNLDILGKELGMDLELVQTEAAVGAFSLDILAHDVQGKAIVVIENQLNTTDHNHLGQILTYAAGHDAGIVIWITDGFRDEHRQALDWLNQRTDDATRFFGVEMEVFKIGESPPAPHFKIVASPNDWSKRTKADTSRELSPRRMKYRNFFQTLIDELRDNHKFTNAKLGQPQSWYQFASGHSGITYSVSFPQGDQVMAQLSIDRDKESNKQLFDQLKSSLSDIESDLGFPLAWERMDQTIVSRITLYRTGSIEDDEAKLAEIRSWMIVNLLKFKDVFGPRLADLIK
jgi:hypothetical protein